MWFVLRAVAVIAVIAFLSPQRDGAERETARAAREAEARLPAKLPAATDLAAGLPEAVRERIVAEAGRAVAQGAEATLRGALVPGTATR